MVKLGLMGGGWHGEDMSSVIELGQAVEDLGFDTFWMGEGRLTGSAVPAMALTLHHTSRLKVGSGVLPYRTRNVGILAGTFKTLDEMAPGRAIMGLGAWWEPLATRVGLPNRKPLKAMREVITVSKKLLAGETVTYDGEFVNVQDIRFDSPWDDEGRVYDVPVYTGPVRFKMVELSGEIADGVLLDFLVPTTYTREACEHLKIGADRSGRSLDDFGVSQLIICSVDDDDPRQAIDDCKFFLTQYIGQQPHITEFSGADPEIIEKVKSIVGWPTTEAKIREAMQFVPDELVHSVAACGTTAQAVEKIEEYVDAGVKEAVLTPRGNELETARRIAKHVELEV
ncbi:5,10-methylenetetrahydromethanopterin reductase [Aeromicrobium flavum]|uniref:5,10-methylenetetrahydromethanopterin reductase n=1 Tax=Aeromicrobium flavum TaxID=416568 RepID=A0A512HVB1_9ACTN|nr:LLM class flavin-dependent oxidoreductase [Aeromicrobium flavum]GEO89378.1 5,10-methylenetetrahydromethanopterin reductase [Aeromicrobium flavum]